MSVPTAQSDPADRVLSTLNRDGSRRWLYPRVSPGRFLTGRRFVAYALLAIYNLLPWIPINGKPAILLDLPQREFTFFGATFLPTDTLLLMLFMVGVFVAVFLVTALFGRVWCGWACPQTVYLEFVYRPIERLFEGAPDARGRPGKKRGGFRTVLKYAVYFIVSLHLAHTFLAYFVGADSLFEWTTQSPFRHPGAFLLVFAVTGAMLFNFGVFREQTCIVACPYGRLQSVMLDRQSLIIGYDEERGEPRGKARRAKTGDDVALPQLGDCIDCRMCVTTCPTGIDIRDGLQMECIGCAQCIDACDVVMERIGRPRGLIRYSSRAAMEDGRTSLIRPRVFIYPAILAVIAGAFLFVLLNRQPADITLLRSGPDAYQTVADGAIRNDLRVKVVNRSEEMRTFALGLRGVDDASLAGDTRFTIEPGATRVANVQIFTPAAIFERGTASIDLHIADDHAFEQTMTYRIQGPWSPGASNTTDGAAETEKDQ